MSHGKLTRMIREENFIDVVDVESSIWFNDQ